MSSTPVTTSFGQRLVAAVERRGTPLVLGLDPDPARLWPGGPAAAPSEDPGAAAAAAVLVHCERLIGATAEHCAAVKLQLACFERLGPAGWQVLHQVAQLARDAGLLVIADGKRGDIDVTADAYASALIGGHQTPWGHVPGLGADAVTVNPLMGRDTLVPFAEHAAAHGAGLFVLVRTSNPGAADLQEQHLVDGRPVWEQLAQFVTELDDEQGPLASVGAVCGATAPDRVFALRELAPRIPLLLPGVGAQGGDVAMLTAAFKPGLAGGLVTVSRAVARAHEGTGASPEAAAAAAAVELKAACLRAADGA